MNKLLISIFLFSVTTLSHAQFGNLLKELENLSKELDNAINKITQPHTGESSQSTPLINSQGLNDNEKYGYLTPNNICAIIDTSASTPNSRNDLDIDLYFGNDLQYLLSVKEVPVDTVISNITSSIDWIRNYNLQNLRIKIRDGYTLEQFSLDLPRMISWFNNKNSGAPCPWGMPFEEVAWVVHYVFGTYLTCDRAARLSGQNSESIMSQIRHCDKYRGRENNNSHMGLLMGASNIDQRIIAQRLFEQRQRLIEIERTRKIDAERKRLEQQRIDQERRNNPFQ